MEEDDSLQVSLGGTCVQAWNYAERQDLTPSPAQDFKKARAMQAIQGFDVLHQLSRLRHAKNVPDAEVELIMRKIADSVQSYEQVVEVRFTP